MVLAPIWRMASGPSFSGEHPSIGSVGDLDCSLVVADLKQPALEPSQSVDAQASVLPNQAPPTGHDCCQSCCIESTHVSEIEAHVRCGRTDRPIQDRS